MLSVVGSCDVLLRHVPPHDALPAADIVLLGNVLQVSIVPLVAALPGSVLHQARGSSREPVCWAAVKSELWRDDEELVSKRKSEASNGVGWMLVVGLQPARGLLALRMGLPRKAPMDALRIRTCVG